MIDFGIASIYMDGEGNHKQQYDTIFTGTPLTGSIQSLSGKNHSRRDDLESLAYTFMLIINQDLVPWKNEGEIPSILRLMKDFIATDPSQLPLEFRHLHHFISEVQKLDYSQEPPYGKLRALIQNFMEPIDAECVKIS